MRFSRWIIFWSKILNVRKVLEKTLSLKNGKVPSRRQSYFNTNAYKISFISYLNVCENACIHKAVNSSRYAYYDVYKYGWTNCFLHITIHQIKSVSREKLLKISWQGIWQKCWLWPWWWQFWLCSFWRHNPWILHLRSQSILAPFLSALLSARRFWVKNLWVLPVSKMAPREVFAFA